ncbi:hypothetical protein FHS36_005231 [Streptomyces eurocidicus]|nr:hypothetical protein [Streptomyces eurocidicus]
MATATTLAGVAIVGAVAPQAHADGARTVAADSADAAVHPQAGTSPLRGAADARQRVTRAQILARAQRWVDADVPYNMNGYHEGYRTDCSGFISMAWALPGNHWTGDLDEYGVRITKDQLRPGDMLLFHNASDPQRGSHVVLFAGWANAERTRYVAMEENGRLGTVKRTIPYAYVSNSPSYIPYRYKNLQEDGGDDGAPGGAFPGTDRFGPGADNAYVTRLGTMLVGRGGGGFYKEGPGPTWGPADGAATRAFQEAQGWRGADADGIPGAHTWRLLVEGRGRDIGRGRGGRADAVPEFPGAHHFGPGRSNRFVSLLGKQLVKKGFGTCYGEGPGPVWSESDRRAVEAFQRAQGWRGSDADGLPGAHTWRLLFS